MTIHVDTHGHNYQLDVQWVSVTIWQDGERVGSGTWDGEEIGEVDWVPEEEGTYQVLSDAIVSTYPDPAAEYMKSI